MIHLYFLAFGVLNALLCHWMIRHTYEGFENVKTENLDNFGRIKYQKQWVHKLKKPRWFYIMLWMVCLLLAPASFVASVAMGICIKVKESENEWKFVYTNRFIEWLKKEV